MKNGYKCADCRKLFQLLKARSLKTALFHYRNGLLRSGSLLRIRKGIASLQIHRDLGITQKSAWFMLQRIRHAIQTKSFNAPLNGIVEADETYIYGRAKNKHKSKRLKGVQGRSTKGKTPVFGMLERRGGVMAMKVDNVTKKEIHPIILENISKDAILMTDEWSAYKGLSDLYKHYVVNGDCHTNTIEGFWSLFKRMLYGIYHNVSDRHLQKYVDEMSFRYNTRDIHCADRFNNMVALSNTRLTYKQLIKN